MTCLVYLYDKVCTALYSCREGFTSLSVTRSSISASLHTYTASISVPCIWSTLLGTVSSSAVLTSLSRSFIDQFIFYTALIIHRFYFLRTAF